jgi:type IV secretory pathway VirJ component
MRRLPFLTVALVLLVSRTALSQEISSFSVAPFGTVRVYGTAKHASQVVILSSGGKGWNREAQDFAEKFVSLDCLVMGVNTKEYLGPILAKSNCTYPGADFQNLSRFVQQKLGLSSYTRPIMAGYAAGAALTYATIVQAPSSAFAGGISIGFCPNAPLTRAFCQGLGLDWSKDGKNLLLPPAGLRTPWIVLPFPENDGCSRDADAFLKKVAGVKVISPSTQEGSGPMSKDTMLAQAMRAFSAQEERPVSAQEESVKDLPLIEIPAKGEPDKSGEGLMAVMISGDGGWAGLDREVGDAIAGSGVPLVGFNSLKYFWTPRTPDKTARDITDVISHYLKSWGKEKLILIGYSFGADVLPFVVNRLPEDIKARIDLVVLMGPSTSAQFEFHLSNWFEGASDGARPTLPEAKMMKAKRVVCLFGKGEADSLCRSLDASVAQVIALPGGHHFDGDYPALAGTILSLAGLNAKTR